MCARTYAKLVYVRSYLRTSLHSRLLTQAPFASAMAFKVCVKRTFVDVEEVAVHSARTRASSCPARYSKVSSCTTSTQTPKACKASQTMTVMSSSVPWHWGLSGVSARGLVESMANLNARLRASHGCDANPVGNEMKSCKLTKPPLRALRFHELLWPPVREHANVQDEKDSQDSEERQVVDTRTTASLRKPKKPVGDQAVLGSDRRPQH